MQPDWTSVSTARRRTLRVEPLAYFRGEPFEGSPSPVPSDEKPPFLLGAIGFMGGADFCSTFDGTFGGGGVGVGNAVGSGASFFMSVFPLGSSMGVSFVGGGTGGGASASLAALRAR